MNYLETEGTRSNNYSNHWKKLSLFFLRYGKQLFDALVKIPLRWNFCGGRPETLRRGWHSPLLPRFGTRFDSGGSVETSCCFVGFLFLCKCWLGIQKDVSFAYAFEWMGVKRIQTEWTHYKLFYRHNAQFTWFYLILQLDSIDCLNTFLSATSKFSACCHVRRQCPALEIPLRMMARWQHWNIPSCQQRPKPWTLRGAKKGRKKHSWHTPVHPK